MDEQAVEFFREHAGLSYRPAVETPEQGRERGARELARAERWAKDQGIRFAWADDYHDERPDYTPQTCEYVVALDEDGNNLTGLGCIDDADDDYRRVIEAELALEAMDSALSPAWSQAGC